MYVVSYIRTLMYVVCGIVAFLFDISISHSRRKREKLGGGGGVATQKKPNATANFKFGTGFFRFFFGFFRFFSVFPFWPILTGLTASC